MARPRARLERGAVRSAVRRGLADLAGGEPRAVVLVALSGGPDSLALADAAAYLAVPLRLRVGAVVVDHGLQDESAAVAAKAAQQARELGLDPVEVVRVRVEDSAGEGPEAAARTARYAALDEAAARLGAAAVLLGHTRDDQAESVLLGLLRGSGAQSLAGMPAARGRYRRPLLGLDRAVTVAACAAAGLVPWADPHNDDPAYARVRARALVADLEERLGPGARAGLARSAELLRLDAEALTAWSDAAYDECVDPAGTLDCVALQRFPTAVRARVLRRVALAAGARAADLTSTHVVALDALVSDWHGQGPVDLPGGVQARRVCGRLAVDPAPTKE